ncbi:MAG: glycosyltransferase [Chitinophagaceae bacterium]|nr:MAG: glycosyltransferase [Chitinophagaceae bacterium]
MQASVIISYYKHLPNLALILQGLQRQETGGKKFEVIISEDDEALETLEFLSVWRERCSFPLKHLHQPDAGFRKCRALNLSIKAAESDLLIFIDGDCVPHPKFVAEYINCKAPHRVLYGRRVMLGEAISKTLLQQDNLTAISIFNLVAKGSKRVEEGLYLPWVPQNFKHKNADRLLGCNMGINKEDLIAINGFDEDYTAAGAGEDSDIEWRLEALKGIQFFSMKFRAIVYHLYHPLRFTPAMEQANYRLLHAKMKDGFYVCKNGLEKLP